MHRTAASVAEKLKAFGCDEVVTGIGNESEEPARVLMFSEVVTPTATVYPDSDKVGIWTGNPDVDLVVPRSAGVEYYEGEK